MYVRTLRAPLGANSIVPHSGVASQPLCKPSGDMTRASCFASVLASGPVTGYQSSVPGVTPWDLSYIYNYPAPGSQSQTNETIGIVVAYDAPNAESDLATYRSHFGLPPCTTANGCFTKVMVASAASGGGTAPPSSITPHPTAWSGGWPDETDIDIETATAVCANCSIVLAEAASDNLSDLAVAVTAAVQNGANVVNASFGAPESSSQANLESYFEPNPVKVVAAAGDSGPGAYFPASASKVIAVAGTTINLSSNYQISESLWSGSGGGCSSIFSRNAYSSKVCSNSKRSVADVAADADPLTGVAVYDSRLGGWLIAGGTSVSAPIIAGIYALSGDTSSGNGATTLYLNAGSFSPVQNGGTYVGVGVPNGLGGF
jgi:subtilase family serine protease